ncbi:hypothetical protein [Candidatus Chloroploca sp. Khr17]|uniref:hypothetical protein n=1 Tax=Candidatus Chloroploca sp. Khr17 TaxID=2496869 RepID=UPI00101D73ED|nr:hypothetical protein [Candidatus Chloroploca sp. Khr17]
MSELVTLALPEPLVESARAVAARTQRRVEDVLVEWLDRAAAEVPVVLLPDDQVLALRDLEMDAAAQAELSLQRNGTYTGAGPSRFGSTLESPAGSSGLTRKEARGWAQEEVRRVREAQPS